MITVSIAKRRILTAALCGAAIAGVFELLDHPPSIRAQTTRLQIASISVSADQTLTYPTAPPASPYLEYFPDEHTTFIPPATSGSPYLIFAAAGGISTSPMGQTVALQSMDLQTFTFAAGYNNPVMTIPIASGTCNPAYDTEFDEGYAAPGSVLQDPTLPVGNLLMIYEAENHCFMGNSTLLANVYTSTGFARSSDNGKTWPAPQNGPTGGPNRYPAVQPSTPFSTWVTSGGGIGDATPSAFVDLSLDGNYYLYAAYSYYGPDLEDGEIRMARAKLGQNQLSFQKWYGGSFSQPGINGLENGVTSSCPGYQYQSLPQISYLDDLGVYLMTLVCANNSTLQGAWYYATATSLDLQDWTPLQLIANSQHPITLCGANGTDPNGFDGWYPSFMSPGAAVNHLKLTGSVFYLNGCQIGARTFASRTFTITTQPQPAPVLTSGSLANGATYISGGLVPGSWAQVRGTGLASTTRIWTSLDFVNLGSALPTSLSGVQVMVNNTPAAVYYISPTQIDFQVPTGVSGTASVYVINNGTASNTLTAAAVASAPGLFPNTINGVNYPAATYAIATNFVGPAGVPGYLPASVGYHLILYATGLAAQPGGVLPTAQPISGVTVTLGNIVIPADFAGQTPYVGEFQINFTVPQVFATMPAGNYPISISLNGVSSPTTINTSPPGLIVVPVVP